MFGFRVERPVSRASREVKHGPLPQKRLRLRDHFLKNIRSSGTVVNKPDIFAGDDCHKVKILSLPRLRIRLS